MQTLYGLLPSKARYLMASHLFNHHSPAVAEVFNGNLAA
jgi:hypothetical protein